MWNGARPGQIIFSFLVVVVLALALYSIKSIRDARRACHTRKGTSGGIPGEVLLVDSSQRKSHGRG